MKWFAPILIVFLCSFSLRDEFIREKETDASYDALRKYTVEELKQDIAALRAKYERHNPNLYLYNSKAALDKYFDSLSSGITAPMTDMEFYRYLGPITSRIKDAHTSVFPNDVSEYWYGDQKYFIPLLITCNTGKIITDLCASPDRTIPDGSEIISINGNSSEEILERLRPYAPRDGYNTTRVSWMINNFFSYYYCYCIEASDSFKVVYRPNGGYAMSHTISATTVDSIWYNAYKYYPNRYITGRRDSTITLRFREDSSIAIMRLRSFSKTGRKNQDESFRKTITHCFNQINNAKVKNLIIDVRDNAGGDPDYARFVISHLINMEFIYIQEFRSVEKLRWNDEENRLHSRWYPYCGIGTFPPEKNCYKGKLYVLMDGGSTSTAGDFVACLDYYNRATFIGEESGANRVVSGGNVFGKDFELPNTRLRVRLSTIQAVNKTDITNDGHGVIPDYVVVPTPEDYMNFRNPMLEKAIELIHTSSVN
jgi:uncharacterized small protein (DUF1192 family)